MHSGNTYEARDLRLSVKLTNIIFYAHGIHNKV